VFVKDLITQAVTLVSADANGVEGNGESIWPIFSPDGTEVAFSSAASNLLAGSATPGQQIYIKNLQSAAVTLVSSDANGLPGNGFSLYPMFSPDGSKVTFDSVSTNLVPGVTSGTLDIYVKEPATGAISLASSDANGNEGNNGSLPPVFAPDGTKIGFESLATNLIPGGTTNTQVFVKDLLTGVVTLLATNSNGDQGNGFSSDPNFSAGHTAVAFDSSATNFGVASGGATEIFERQIFSTSGFVVDNLSATTLATAGQVSFSDSDLTDTHSVTVMPQVGDLGTLTATMTQDTTGTGTGGVVTWSYQVNETGVHALGAAVTDSFTLTVLDSQGCTATTAITVMDLPQDFNGASAAAVSSSASTSSCPVLTVTTSPTNLTVPVGELASFAAAASGTPAPTVQWQLSTDGGVTFSNIAGATSTGLAFIASLTQSGNFYRAVFTNPSGSVTSNAALLTVTVAPTSASLVSTPNPSVFGQAVTLRALISTVSTATPTGTVTFVEGPTTIGTAPVDPSGNAVLTVASLAVGTHLFIATYGGDSNFAPSSASLSPVQTVNKDGVSVTLASSANSSVSGQPVSFTAVVAASAPGAGTPTGTFSFLDGGAPLGTANLVNGQASFTAPLPAGSHSITAGYGGDGNFNAGASTPLLQTVNKDASALALVSSANPSVFGQPVAITAAVTATPPGAGTPTGVVSFQDGTTNLGTVTLVNGQASVALAAPAVGSHSITAAYAGDGNFSPSSSALVQMVGQVPTVTTISSSVNPSVLNQSLVFTATVGVAPPNTGAPTGSITFKDGTAVLGSAPLNTSGTAALTAPALAVGPHNVTAAYSGDANFAASASVNLAQSVQYAAAGSSCDGAAGHQILPPIDPAGMSVLKQGRTVPALFRVCDANGVSIGTPGVVSSFLLVGITNGTSASSVVDPVDTNNPDTAFRWDPVSQQWIFNIDTGNLGAGNTYVYAIGLNDGTAINFQYGLR
ncbi:MAG TPA: Ig-like domain repeat protein, partial [Candidatus Angelobacter sp.]